AVPASANRQRRFRTAGSGAQPRLGRVEESQLRAKSAREPGIDLPLRIAHTSVIRTHSDESAGPWRLVSGPDYSQTGAIQACRRSDIDSGARVHVLAAAEPQDRPGPRDPRIDPGRLGARADEVYKFA